MGILVSFQVLASYLILYSSLAFVLKKKKPNFVAYMNSKCLKVNRLEFHGKKNNM